MKKHLAIMDKSSIEAIINGKKTVETRFSKHRIIPFGQVSVGDLVYMKPPGEEIFGQFRVKKVYSFEGLTQKDVNEIFEKYGKDFGTGNQEVDKKYFQSKKDSLFGTLMFIGDSERFITSPIKIKKTDLRGWVVLK